MKLGVWKAIAITFIILFAIETIWIVWAFWYYYGEQDRTNEYYYSICNENVDAYYESGVCYCYDYSIMGDLQIVKTEYLK